MVPTGSANGASGRLYWIRRAFNGLAQSQLPWAFRYCWNVLAGLLVVKGLYRYVRNPMYVAVSLLIFGQGLLFGSVPILRYGVIVFVGFHLFVMLYEEPALRRKFGKEYELYCENVRRWWQRIRAW